jgi:hypothetical protein
MVAASLFFPPLAAMHFLLPQIFFNLAGIFKLE